MTGIKPKTTWHQKPIQPKRRKVAAIWRGLCGLWDNRLNISSVDVPALEKSYPIVTYTWMFLSKKYDDPNKAIAMEVIIQFRQKQAAPLGYIALPFNVRERVAAAADEITPDFEIKLTK